MARHGITTPQQPIILAMEHSSMCGSIALVAKGQCICEYSLNSRSTHSRRLLDSIAYIMMEAGLDWPDIAALAISTGPGSFTGLRIGMTTAKGLVMATNKKLIGISSLDGLANQLVDTDRLICPMIDARKNEVYTAFYRCNSNGHPEQISKIIAITPEKLAAKIDEKIVFLGDGSAIYKEVLKESLGSLAHFARPEVFYPRASVIGRLASQRWKINEFMEPGSATPEYVRASDAEINFGKHLKI